jgi:hypothetical protein
MIPPKVNDNIVIYTKDSKEESRKNAKQNERGHVKKND